MLYTLKNNAHSNGLGFIGGQRNVWLVQGVGNIPPDNCQLKLSNAPSEIRINDDFGVLQYRENVIIEYKTGAFPVRKPVVLDLDPTTPHSPYYSVDEHSRTAEILEIEAVLNQNINNGNGTKLILSRLVERRQHVQACLDLYDWGFANSKIEDKASFKARDAQQRLRVELVLIDCLFAEMIHKATVGFRLEPMKDELQLSFHVTVPL
jgi:hypothetical protein